MTAKDLIKFTGVAPRTLDFWVRSKLLEPSVTAANGAGSKREYSMNDVVQCRIAVLLRDMGVETSRIARFLEYVPNKAIAFIIVDPNPDGGIHIATFPKTTNLSIFQPNTTAMILINVAAIRASYTLESEVWYGCSMANILGLKDWIV